MVVPYVVILNLAEAACVEEKVKKGELETVFDGDMTRSERP